MAIFAKIANFAKIASLQGATFGIQFKSPAAGDFLPVSPFSPLHAFLDISASFPTLLSWARRRGCCNSAVNRRRCASRSLLTFFCTWRTLKESRHINLSGANTRPDNLVGLDSSAFLGIQTIHTAGTIFGKSSRYGFTCHTCRGRGS